MTNEKKLITRIDADSDQRERDYALWQADRNEIAALTERAEKAEEAYDQMMHVAQEKIDKQATELAKLRGRLEAHHARTDLPGTLGCPICARGQAPAEGE